jgi:hypothetical protein
MVRMDDRRTGEHGESEYREPFHFDISDREASLFRQVEIDRGLALLIEDVA